MVHLGYTLSSEEFGPADLVTQARLAEAAGFSFDKGGWVELPNPNGGIGLSFHIEDVYVRPVWPSKPGEQIMQMHLEIQVDDLDAGCAHAQACEATLAEYQPQVDVRVHLDPDGHPFCLYL